MRYQVTYRKRFNDQAEPADSPAAVLSVPDGVILDSEVVEMIEPASVHVAGDISAGTGSQSSNDDGFLAFGTETWVYDVAEGREQEFKDAVINTELALDIEEFEE